MTLVSKIRLCWLHCPPFCLTISKPPVSSVVALCLCLLFYVLRLCFVDLAHTLNQNKTHLIGTLKKKRKHNPNLVVSARLSKGEMVACQSNTKCIVAKWRDKRDVLFLTTKDVPTLTEIATRRGIQLKPSTILDYNGIKSYINISDQMVAYGTTVRKGVKWYRKVGIELLTNTSVVNAHAVYNKVTGPNGKKVSITEFREKLSMQLIYVNVPRNNENNRRSTNQHKLQEKGHSRCRCSLCYTKMAESQGRLFAAKHAKQVTTNCVGCPDIPYMCLNCFFGKHMCQVKN